MYCVLQKELEDGYCKTLCVLMGTKKVKLLDEKGGAVVWCIDRTTQMASPWYPQIYITHVMGFYVYTCMITSSRTRSILIATSSMKY